MERINWEQAKAIIGEALDQAAGDRIALINARCAGNEALRSEVLSLIAASESSEALLDEATDAWIGAAGEPTNLPSQGRIGDFEIVRLIAQSATAAVYLANQRHPERPVALKVLRTAPLLGPDPRFWLEASAAARVEHPCVVRVYEAGVAEVSAGHRAAYIAMEYVDGVPLTRAVRDLRMNAWQIASLMEEIARGVARIHQCGVIHRDLKPTNVLVDASGRPRVVDFGIARLVANPEATWSTVRGAVAGTPGYMSPEGIERPAEVDVRSDVWALGAMAYELLTGAAPFVKEGTTPLDVIRRTVCEDVARLRSAAPGVPSDLEAVVMKALARSPADRYPSATAFADDIVNARECRPVVARHAKAVYRARRFVRRNALLLTVVGVVGVAVFGLGLAQIVALNRAARERERAGEVVGLLREMISSANPSSGRRDARVVDVLHGLETQLHQNAQLDALTEADVRSLLGAMYFSLGEYDRSRALLEAAIALREQGGAGASAESCMDKASLVYTLRWLYELDKATALADNAVAQALRRFGPRHAATLAVREARAGCLLDAQEFDLAEREYRDVLESARLLHGADSREVLGIRGNLAHLLTARGNYSEAELMLRKLVQDWERHPGMLEGITARVNLASVLAEQGKLELAIEMLAEADAQGVRALGQSHPTLVTARTNAIEFLRRSGRDAEALHRSTLLLHELTSEFGPTHDLTLTQVVGQVAALIRAGRSDEAVSLAESARNACQAALPPGSAWHARMESSVAAALGGAGQFTQSLEMHRSALSRLEAQLGESHRQTLVARNNLGVAQIESGDAAAAMATLEELLTRVRVLGYEEMLTSVMRNLGRAQCNGGATAAGIGLLEEAYTLSVERQEMQNADVCARLLAEQFARIGDDESARKWRERTMMDPDRRR